MFRAFLCPSSGALDYKCVLVAYGGQCLASGCRGSGAGQEGVRPGRGMPQHPLAAGCRRSGAGQQGVCVQEVG